MVIKPRLVVKKLRPYVPPTEDRTGKLRLDFNENTRGCSPKVQEALRKVTSEEIATYPKYGEFIKKLATYLDLPEEEILLTNGADEAIQVVMNTYLDKGQEVIIPEPTFTMFKIYASLAEAKIIFVPYNDDLTFPMERILKKITPETKVIIFANPNNPTGSIAKNGDIVKILKKAKARNSLVVIDEAYWQYSGKSSKDLLEKYDNLAIIQTFSKAFGLAGLRLGYILSNKEVIMNLKRIISPYSVSNLGIIAASAALEDLTFVKNYVKEVKESKIILETEFNKLGLKTFPSEANFLLANFGEKCQQVYEELKAKGILVRDRSSYPLLKNCLRITLGTKEQTKKLIKEIKNILKENVLLFDLDGVLVDVSKSYRRAIKKTVEYFTQQKISFGEIQELKEQGNYNNDWDLTEKIILKRKVKIPKNKLIQKFQEFYLENRNKERWLFKKKILRELYKNYKLGIVTERPREEAFFTLEKFNVKDYFDAVVAMEDMGGRKKPHPYGINLALEKLGEDNALYFGDNVDDMKAAKNAGITAIGVLPPGYSKNLKSLLQEKGAKFVIKDVNKIEEALK